MPVATARSQDDSLHVRAALASAILDLTPVLGKEGSINTLLPVFLQLLRDPSPEVRLNVISQLKNANEVVGLDAISKSLLPAIEELAADKQWRVKLAIIEYVPGLAGQLGQGFFKDSLQAMSLAWLWYVALFSPAIVSHPLPLMFNCAFFISDSNPLQ